MDGHDADVEDHVADAAPIHPVTRASDEELQSFPKSSTDAKKEPKIRKQRRKRLIRESHQRHNASAVQEATHQWSQGPYSQGKLIHPPMVLGPYDTYPPNYEGMKLPERVHLSRGHNTEAQLHTPYPTSDWQLMNEQMNMAEAYNNAYVSNMGGIPHPNQNAFIEGSYSIMQAPTYDRPSHYYPRAQGDCMPYQHMHQPQDLMHAYFADVR